VLVTAQSTRRATDDEFGGHHHPRIMPSWSDISGTTRSTAGALVS
jgi:hypothetical protein